MHRHLFQDEGEQVWKERLHRMPRQQRNGQDLLLGNSVMAKINDNHLNVYVVDRNGKAISGAVVRFFDGNEQLGSSTIAGDNQPAQIDLPPAYAAVRVLAEVRGCKPKEATVDISQRNFEFRFEVGIANTNGAKKKTEWSRADILTFAGLLVAIIAGIAAWLAVPGIPKCFHGDSDSSGQHNQTRANAGVPKVRDVSSGQVNFACEQTLPVETPTVSFGRNPRNIDTRPTWINTDNAKTQNQSVTNIEDPADHHVTGVKAVGTITGRDSQTILGVRNCPGGGHGELTLRVSWTEDQ